MCQEILKKHRQSTWNNNYIEVLLCTVISIYFTAQYAFSAFMSTV